MINRNDLTNDVQQIISNKESQEPIKIDSYDKSDIDYIYNEIIDIIQKCITDDYYSQEYIDSFLKNVKQKIQTIITSYDTYNKLSVDSILNTLKLLLAFKINKSDTIVINNEYVDSLINSIHFNGIDSYTTSEFDSKLTNLLNKNTVGNSIISVKDAYDKNIIVNNLEQQLITHLNKLCVSLTGKGIDTPNGSGIYTICSNIAKLNPSGTEYHDEYELLKILDLPEQTCSINSDSDASIYISSYSSIYKYSSSGALQLQVQKEIPDDPVGVMIHTRKDVEYIVLVDKRHSVVVTNKTDLTRHTYTLTNITSDVLKCCILDFLYPTFIGATNSFDAGMYGIISILSSGIYLIGMDSAYVIDLYCKVLSSFNLLNSKIYSNGRIACMFDLNKIWFTQRSPIDMYGNTDIYTIDSVTNINCMDCSKRFFFIGADNSVYKLNIFNEISETVYTGTDPIRKIVSASDYLIHILEGDNKLITLDLKNDKSTVTELLEYIKDMYIDSLNRVICVSNISIYYIHKIER